MLVRSLFLLILAGCAARRAGDAVRAVRFESDAPGVGGAWGTQSARNLRRAMDHPQPRWQSFLLPGWIEPAWLDRRQLDDDGRRLEVWYANHGYFDARFEGWTVVRPDRREGRRVRPVRVVGHLDPGLPSRVASITWEGIDGLDRAKQRQILDIPELAEGDVFDRDAWRAALADIEAALRARAHAYAKVTGRVTVRADEHAVDLHLVVSPGPVCRFGEVEVLGLDRIARERIEPKIVIEPGKGFRPSKIARTRSNLFGLRVFTVVNVVPVLADPPNAVVPIRVEVEEGPAREMQAGPGLALEPGLQSVYASVRYTDHNLGNRLWTTEAELRAGVTSAWSSATDAAASGQAIPVAPLAELRTTLALPHLFGGDFAWTHEGVVDLGLENAERYIEPSYAPAIAWQGYPYLVPSVGYRVRYHEKLGDFGVPDEGSSNTQSRDDEFPDVYLLSMLEQKVVWDSRDDPLQPRHGWYWSLDIAEAGLGGDYQFVRGRGDARAYRSIPRLFGQDLDLVAAGRLGGGIILPYGRSTQGVPEPERLFLGGGNNVRGWITNRLGPVEYDPFLPPEERRPVGGNLALHGSAELRTRVWYDLWLAGFVDAGRVWAEVPQARFGDLQWSVGPGVRYVTPIGPVRADVGFVIGRDPLFADEPGWNLHLGLSEAF